MAQIPAAVAEALEHARHGPLKYEDASILIQYASWGGRLPPRPEQLGAQRGGCVYWEEPGHRRRRQRVAGGARGRMTADTWKNSGGKRPLVNLPDPEGQAGDIDRRAGKVVQKSST